MHTRKVDIVTALKFTILLVNCLLSFFVFWTFGVLYLGLVDKNKCVTYSASKKMFEKQDNYFAANSAVILSEFV